MMILTLRMRRNGVRLYENLATDAVLFMREIWAREIKYLHLSSGRIRRAGDIADINKLY